MNPCLDGELADVTEAEQALMLENVRLLREILECLNESGQGFAALKLARKAMARAKKAEEKRSRNVLRMPARGQA